MTGTKAESFVIRDHDPYEGRPNDGPNEGMGAVEPDVHCFAGQKPEEVKQTCEGSPKARCQAKTLDQIEKEEALREAEAILNKEMPGWDTDLGKAKETRAKVQQEVRERRDKARLEKERKGREAQARADEKDREEVKSFISKMGDLKIQHKDPDGKLMYDKEKPSDWMGDYDLDIRNRRKSEFTGGCQDVNPEWRALAGLCNREDIIEREPMALEIMESIIHLLGQRVPHLTAEWGGDCWNKNLMLNGANTSINSLSLKHAYEGLKGIASEIEAARSVTELIVNRITSLFVAV